MQVCHEEQRRQLIAAIQAHVQTLKKMTYGKHIVVRVEKLLEAAQALDAQVYADTDGLCVCAWQWGRGWQARD